MMLNTILGILDVTTFAIGQFAGLVSYLVDRHNGPETPRVRSASGDYSILAHKLRQICCSALSEEFAKNSTGLRLIGVGDIQQGVKVLHREYYKTLMNQMKEPLAGICVLLASGVDDGLCDMVGVSFVNNMRTAYHTAAPWSDIMAGGVTGRVSDLKMQYVDKSKFLRFLEMLDRLRYYESAGVRGKGLLIPVYPSVRIESDWVLNTAYGDDLSKIYDVVYTPGCKRGKPIVELIPRKAYIGIEEALDRLEGAANGDRVSHIAISSHRVNDDSKDPTFCKKSIINAVMGGHYDEFVYNSHAMASLAQKVFGVPVSLVDLTDREECVTMFGLVGKLSESGLKRYVDRLEAMTYTCAIFTSLEYLSNAFFNDAITSTGQAASPTYPTIPALSSLTINPRQIEGDR